jgi:AraC-like DNA-binding protein
VIFPEDMVVTKITSRGIPYKKSKSLHVGEEHAHFLTFRISGTKQFHTKGAEKPFVSGVNSITYIPRGLAYEEETLEDGYMLALHFALLEDTPAEAFILHPASPISYRNLFEELAGSYRVGAERDYRSMALLYELFAMCRHESDRAARHAVPRRIRTALTRINSDFADPELSVAALAEEAGVSEVYFRRLFKECYGVSAVRYRLERRLSRACEYLTFTDTPISEISDMLGFGDTSYFIKCFRERYSVSPLVYRRQYSNKLENRIDELEEESFDNIMDKIHLEFYERHVVIVGDDGTRKYHKYGCDDLDTSYFWAYNTEKAEQLGYYACPKCH